MTVSAEDYVILKLENGVATSLHIEDNNKKPIPEELQKLFVLTKIAENHFEYGVRYPITKVTLPFMPNEQEAYIRVIATKNEGSYGIELFIQLNPNEKDAFIGNAVLAIPIDHVSFVQEDPDTTMIWRSLYVRSEELVIRKK